MATIICNLNMFSKSPIFLDNDGELTALGYANTEELHKVICEFCKQHNVTDVKLFGGTLFAEGIANDIVIYNRIEYSNNDIRVEVL